MDYAHKKTEGMLDSLEKRLAHEYAQAERELTDELDDYMWRHSVKDRIWLNKVANGEITWERYQQWKIGQVCIGERWTEMRDTIAEDMHHTNEIAGSIVNGYLPEVYALNHNYATYEAEVGALVDTSYTLYDRQTVERMMRDNPDMLPPPGKRVSERIRAGKDVRWNEQQLQSITTQAILQGEGIQQLAGRIQSTFGDSFTIEDIRDIEHKTASQIAHELTKKNKSAAIRNARTMMTGAQNAGRVDGYKRAKDMGIDLRQQWLATLDGRTRHEHRQLDGQIVDVGEPFKVDGYEIRFPGDPTAEAHLVYNCRCTLIAAIKGFEHDLSDTSSRYDANLEGMTYEEWKNAKEKKSATKTDTETVAQSAKQKYPTYYKPLNIDTFANEYVTAEEIELVNERFQQLDETYHARVENVITTLEREQREYDLYYNNYVRKLRDDNPRMRDSTIRKRAVEVLGERPEKVSVLLGGDYMFSTGEMTINNLGVHLSGGILDDIEKRSRTIARNAQRVADGKRRRAFGNSGDTLESTFIHEYGHAIDATYDVASDGRFIEFYNGFTEEQILYGVSDYATTNAQEFIAECFAESFMGETQGEISRRFMSILDEIIFGGAK